MDNKHRRRAAETWFTPASAAQACGVDVATIRRRLRTGQIPGARRTGPQSWDPWEIPLSGLVAAGLCTNATANDAPTASPPADPPVGELSAARHRIAELEALVASLEAICDQQRRLLDRMLLAEVA